MITASVRSDPQAIPRCKAALRDRIRLGTLKLPVLPRAAHQVMTIARDPEADLSELSTLIHRDQALASHVLRVANSAAYGGSTPIVSLQQAVTRLGLKLLADIAVTISLQGEVFRLPGFQPVIKDLWRHALASAVWAKEIARAKRSSVEGLFLCGLLHTIGKPVALRAITEIEPGLDRNNILALMEEFHVEIGAAVAEAWNLPEQVRVACQFYQDYAAAPAFRREAAITWLAGALAAITLRGTAASPASLVEHRPAQELNFYADELETLLESKDEVTQFVSAMDL